MTEAKQTKKVENMEAVRKKKTTITPIYNPIIHECTGCGQTVNWYWDVYQNDLLRCSNCGGELPASYEKWVGEETERLSKLKEKKR